MLYGADLRDCDLRRASLVRADLRGACLRGANLAGADLGSCDMREGVIAVQDFEEGLVILRHDVRPGELDYVVMDGTNLAGVQNSEGLAIATDFRDAVLAGARLVRARMVRTMLDGADLSGANIFQADLAGASLKRAVLTDVAMDGANLQDADLSGALMGPPPMVYVDDEPLQQVLVRHQLWCVSDGAEGAPERSASWRLARRPPGWPLT